MDFIRAQDPLIVFIVETWLDKPRLEFIKSDKIWRYVGGIEDH